MDFFKTFQDQLPSTQEAKPYMEVARRLSQLFSLASLLPVIGDIRFGFARQRRHGSDFDGTWVCGGATITIKLHDHPGGVRAVRSVDAGKGNDATGHLNGNQIDWMGECR